MLPPETSEISPLRVDFLPDNVLNLPGKIGITIAPGKKGTGLNVVWNRDLNQDLAHLRQHYGTSVLVCLMEQQELSLLEIPDLLTQSQLQGMQTDWFPIPDLSTPASMDDFMALVQRIVQAVRDQQTVVICCRGGLGRTGLVAACCLVLLGEAPEKAIVTVRQVRTGAIETKIQQQYIVRFFRAVNSAARQTQQSS